MKIIIKSFFNFIYSFLFDKKDSVRNSLKNILKIRIFHKKIVSFKLNILENYLRENKVKLLEKFL